MAFGDAIIIPRFFGAGTQLYELDWATGAATAIGGSYNGTIWAMANPQPQPADLRSAIADWDYYE